MKHDDVVVGAVYLTKVGAETALVRVVRETSSPRFGGRTRRRAFDVERVDRPGVLPKARTAAAMHPPYFVVARTNAGETEAWGPFDQRDAHDRLGQVDALGYKRKGLTRSRSLEEALEKGRRAWGPS